MGVSGGGGKHLLLTLPLFILGQNNQNARRQVLPSCSVVVESSNSNLRLGN